MGYCDVEYSVRIDDAVFRLCECHTRAIDDIRLIFARWWRPVGIKSLKKGKAAVPTMPEFSISLKKTSPDLGDKNAVKRDARSSSNDNGTIKGSQKALYTCNSFSFSGSSRSLRSFGKHRVEN